MRNNKLKNTDLRVFNKWMNNTSLRWLAIKKQVGEAFGNQ